MSSQQAREYFWKSERIGFSKWRETDLDLAKSLWGDKEVSKYVFISEPTEQMIIDRFHSELENQAKYGVAYWPIFTLCDNEFIGVTGLKAYSFEPGDTLEGCYMLGYHLMKNAWGKGYATEAAKACVKYAFENLNASNIFAGHHPHNEASGKVLLKSGFYLKMSIFFPFTKMNHPIYYYKKDDRCLVKWMEDPEAYFKKLESYKGAKKP
ncbi:N-acetyltransferase GCN5 [Tritrichomonas foetus]|uniref:N-acetyltransferase GCN5 n=1 Tax=Tritrichomonas foetus TaxID=1144522 RepID=A0A1J4L2W4_9EUKA|nr:N-acetyltransferase GCN5 [Tritrichomonas foetus]|eukprot:OHT16245.1 N-acetyltransferase GCN5 [Tritrichomonas foetus]